MNMRRAFAAGMRAAASSSAAFERVGFNLNWNSLPAHQTGDLIVAVAGGRTDGNITVPSGFTLVERRFVINVAYMVAYKFAQSSSEQPPSPVPGGDVSEIVFVYRGANSSDPIGATASHVVVDHVVDTSAITLENSGSAVILVSAQSGGFTGEGFVHPVPYVLRADNERMQTYEMLPGDGQPPPVHLASAYQRWLSFQVEIKPAS